MNGYLKSMVAVAGTILLLTACASHGLRCTRLQPVNPPAQKAAQEAIAPASRRHP